MQRFGFYLASFLTVVSMNMSRCSECNTDESFLFQHVDAIRTKRSSLVVLRSAEDKESERRKKVECSDMEPEPGGCRRVGSCQRTPVRKRSDAGAV